MASADLSYIIEKAKQPLPPNFPEPSAFLSRIHPLSPEACSFLDSKAFYVEIPKGKVIIKAGQVCKYMFLLQKGIVRGYMLDGKREITTWVTSEIQVVTSISSFFTQTPSAESMQTLEPCKMTVMYHEDVEELYRRFPESNIASRKLLQAYYRDAEVRAFIGRMNKARDKFLYFKDYQPQLLKRLPLKIVATYLGVTLETLSRLRSALEASPK